MLTRRQRLIAHRVLTAVAVVFFVLAVLSRWANLDWDTYALLGCGLAALALGDLASTPV